MVHHPIDASIPDAAPVGPLVAARGGACGGRGAAICEAEQSCLRDLPGGYCASRCGLDGIACGDGATCVSTPRAGDVCARACTTDADCRADEGYTCDPVWHACAVPGFAAIVPKRCPGIGKDARITRDPMFAAPEIADAGDALYARAPAAVVTSTGSVVTLAVVGSGLGGNDKITAGGITVGGGDTPVGQPALARSGEALFGAWRSGGERPQIALAVSRDRGATWSAPAEIDEPSDCGPTDASCPERPRLAASARALYLAYSSDAIGTRVRASRDGGATWSAPTTALTGARGDVATSADGRLHVIAMTGGTGGAYGAAQHVIEYTVSADGGRTFTRAVPVSARDELVPAYFANPTLAIDDRRGWLYVAYARGGSDAAWAIVVAASKDKGKTWTRTHVADDGCALAMVPNLAVDGATGTLHVTWYDTRGPRPARFAHATCGPGATRCTDRGAVDAGDFDGLDAGRLDARWVGDAEALVIDDRRHVLHALWSEAMLVGDHPVMRVVHATAKLPVR